MTDTKRTEDVHIRMSPLEIQRLDSMCRSFGGPVVSRSEIIRHALEKLAEEMGVVGAAAADEHSRRRQNDS